MLKRNSFLDKTTFFNTFFVFLFLCNTGVLLAQQGEYELFGAAFEVKDTLHAARTTVLNLEENDPVQTQLAGTIKEVCQAKGCWMKVGLVSGEEVFVRFKDYGFFVPTDASERKVILNGKVFTEIMSVEDQRHYARDKGASEEAINKIQQPKRTLRFEADGVMIKTPL